MKLFVLLKINKDWLLAPGNRTPPKKIKVFKISENQGYAYSLESRDKNKIHLDNLIGYNSIFNHKIVHGTLIFHKVLKQFNYKKLKSVSSCLRLLKEDILDLPKHL